MKHFIGILLFASIAIVYSGCSSGKKAYEKGDYYGAVMKSVSRLRQNTDHKKSLEALQAAYPLAVDYFKTQATNEIASNSSYKWKNAISAYSTINSMYEAIRACPACLGVVKNPVNFYNEIGPLKEKAASESYQEGINALMKGGRVEARKAYYNFVDVQNFVPGYKDVVEYLAKSKTDATLKVVIEQIPVPARYNLSGGFFQDQIEAYVHSKYPDEGFVKFYTPQEAVANNLKNADQILKIQFDDFSVGNSVLREKEETVSKDSVKVGEAKVDGKTIPVYNTVKAKLTTYQKVITSNGLLSMIVVDAKSNAVLSHQKFPGEYVWESRWARFNGDERALSDQQINLTKSRETNPPGAQELFLEFTKPIYGKLISGLQSYYSQFQ